MIDKSWIVYNKKGDFNRLAQKFKIDPVVARILVNRDIREDDMYAFLHPSSGRLHDGRLLKDSDKGAALIKDAISGGMHIRIVGDYDVDGIFSTYILYSAIKNLGGKVSYDIPHRIKDGYGMNRRIVEDCHRDGVELILTCDNGIKAMDEISLAKSYGILVVVTDHHELDFTDKDGKKDYLLPEADAIINPHRPDCDYPFSEICGAFVAQKLVCVLYDLFDRKDEARKYLPYAAFATIGDIMPLVDENRCLVYNGLKALTDIDNPGMRQLISITVGDDKPISAFDVGFVLGPCFNAAGRLESAIEGVELLLEEDSSAALKKAAKLKEFNEQRKAMTEEGTRMASDIIEKQGISDVIVAYVPKLHESLAGIVAGRIKEQYYRPTFILTDGMSGVKGSGRSIPAYSMAKKLHEVDDILTRFGGHPMAAGLSLPKESVDDFRERLNANSGLSEQDLKASLWIDVPMPVSYITGELIEQLQSLEPFGEKNERPLFADRDVTPIRVRYLGKDRLHVKFTLPSNSRGDAMEAIYFRKGEELLQHLADKFGKDELDKLFAGEKSAIKLTFTYYPQINVWQGREVLQVRIEDYM